MDFVQPLKISCEAFQLFQKQILDEHFVNGDLFLAFIFLLLIG